MKLKKPKFWDYKKPNILAYLLLPLTLPIFLKNIISKKINNEFINIKKICVGNIYVGGTGKTPLAVYISNLLNKNNSQSAIIKKFYKDQIDEQKFIEKYASLICKKSRLESLEDALSKKLKYVIFDDGLQDSSVNFDLKIVCFNNVQWIGNGFLMPAGPLRENLNSLKKYDAVVINGDSSENKKIIETIKNIKSDIKIFESYYIPSNLHDLDINKEFIAFSGIGNNENFLNILNKNKFKIIDHYFFPDHYSFNKRDLEKIINNAKNNNAEIITTEKDFLRIDEFFQKKIKFLKIDLKLVDEIMFDNYLKSV
tara:strand:+ start:556 stop:1488 length:933 start_codon:yes stop_codon:yes gene_type:complete